MEHTEPIRASFVLTEDDLLAALREGGREDVGKMRRFFFGTAALLTVATVVATALHSWEAFLMSRWSILLLSGIVSLVFLGWAAPSIMARQARKRLGPSAEIGRCITFALSSSRLHASTEGVSEGTMAISALHSAERRPSGILLTLQPGQVAFIPDRAFASAAERDEFLRRLQAGLALPDPSL